MFVIRSVRAQGIFFFPFCCCFFFFSFSIAGTAPAVEELPYLHSSVLVLVYLWQVACITSCQYSLRYFRPPSSASGLQGSDSMNESTRSAGRLLQLLWRRHRLRERRAGGEDNYYYHPYIDYGGRKSGKMLLRGHRSSISVSHFPGQKL